MRQNWHKPSVFQSQTILACACVIWNFFQWLSLSQYRIPGIVQTKFYKPAYDDSQIVTIFVPPTLKHVKRFTDIWASVCKMGWWDWSWRICLTVQMHPKWRDAYKQQLWDFNNNWWPVFSMLIVYISTSGLRRIVQDHGPKGNWLNFLTNCVTHSATSSQAFQTL